MATTSTTGTGSPLCRFVVSNSRFGAGFTVSVSSHTPMSPDVLDAGKALALKHGATSVAGVGDGAYYTPSAATLQFIRGKVGASVQGSAPAGARGSLATALQADAVSLARAIAAAL